MIGTHVVGESPKCRHLRRIDGLHRCVQILRREPTRRINAEIMEAKVKDLNAKVGELLKENDSLKREIVEMRKLCEQRERAHQSELLAIKKDLEIVKLTGPEMPGSVPGSPDIYSRVKSLKSTKRRPHSLHETMIVPPEVQGQLHKLNGNISEVPNQSFFGSVIPFYFTVENYSHLKKNALKWFSPPFYSHPLGYKMCIEVDVGGSSVGEGTHVSVLAHVMRGEFDEQLKWPLRGLIKIKLLNEVGDHNHFEGIIEYDDDTPLVNSGQVTDRDKGTGWGIPLFIENSKLSHNRSLDCEYLKHDRLCFVVTSVEVMQILS